MEHICYNCFGDSLDENGVCTQCGFDGAKNREKYPLALPLGSILFGRYIIGRVLGQGGFGITYLAQDFQTKGRVAIQEFFPDSMATRMEKTTVCPLSGERGENFAYGLNSFLDEAKTMAEFIGNPNITRVDSYFEENGTGYFVMEYLEGQSFQEYIKAHGGRITWDETMQVVLPVMNALEAMHHKGIIHRDVAPDNIYITQDGTVKLLDFGAARYSLGDVSCSLDVILKHGFAPYEQYNRRGRQGPFPDVYALGATIYYAITGVKPDDAIERRDRDNTPLPTALGVNITHAQEAALMRALAVMPDDRYRNMVQFRAALTAAQPKPPEPEPKQLPKWVMAVAAAVVAVVLCGIGMGVKSSQQKKLQEEARMEAVRQEEAQEAARLEAAREEEARLEAAREEEARQEEAQKAAAYQQAQALMDDGKYFQAMRAFSELDYKDSAEKAQAAKEAYWVTQQASLSAGTYHTVGLCSNGRVLARGNIYNDRCNISTWKDIVVVSAGFEHTVGLHSDGTVVAWDIMVTANAMSAVGEISWQWRQIATRLVCAATAPWWPRDTMPMVNAMSAIGRTSAHPDPIPKTQQPPAARSAGGFRIM